MRTTIDEFRAFSLVPKEQEKKKQLEYHQQAIVAVGKRAETVVAHEGWQVFLDHVGAMRDAATQRRDGLVRKMAEDADVLGDELAKLKVQCVSLNGELRALSAVIDLIPNLIERAKGIELPTPPVARVKGA